LPIGSLLEGRHARLRDHRLTTSQGGADTRRSPPYESRGRSHLGWVPGAGRVRCRCGAVRPRCGRGAGAVRPWRAAGRLARDTSVSEGRLTEARVPAQ